MPVQRLLEIMERLRDPERGCPWDLEQNFSTIAPYTIEEAYEVEDAIRREAWDDLRDELGDLLLQVVFHAQLAREASHFDFEAVIDAVCDKLIRRHPHVFSESPDAVARGAEDVHRTWEERKAKEREEKAHVRGERAGLFDDVPRNLPALLRTAKLEKRARRAGKGPEGEAGHALTEAVAAFADRGDEVALGNLLFAAVRAGVAAGCDAESALRNTNDRFEEFVGRES